MKSRLQKSSVLPSGEKNHRKLKSTPPQNFDQLALSAQKLLNDEHLEVSKVRPFFWSLVETYIDRFQVYPFDVSKALFGYLELQACPEDEVQALIRKLEQLCETKELEVTQIEAQAINKQGAITAVVKSNPLNSVMSDLLSLNRHGSDKPSIDDDVEELRACLKYASLVPEI